MNVNLLEWKEDLFGKSCTRTKCGAVGEKSDKGVNEEQVTAELTLTAGKKSSAPVHAPHSRFELSHFLIDSHDSSLPHQAGLHKRFKVSTI